MDSSVVPSGPRNLLQQGVFVAETASAVSTQARFGFPLSRSPGMLVCVTDRRTSNGLSSYHINEPPPKGGRHRKDGETRQ